MEQNVLRTVLSFQKCGLTLKAGYAIVWKKMELFFKRALYSGLRFRRPSGINAGLSAEKILLNTKKGKNGRYPAQALLICGFLRNGRIAW